MEIKASEIVAYKTPDGEIFECEDKAKSHYDDLLGTELDGLMRLSKINLTRTDEFKLIVGWMNHPNELRKAINSIYELINYSE